MSLMPIMREKDCSFDVFAGRLRFRSSICKDMTNLGGAFVLRNRVLCKLMQKSMGAVVVGLVL